MSKNLPFGKQLRKNSILILNEAEVLDDSIENHHTTWHDSMDEKWYVRLKMLFEEKIPVANTFSHIINVFKNFLP